MMNKKESAKKLVEQLLKAFNLGTEAKDFQQVADELEKREAKGISWKYLKYTLYDGDTDVNVRESKLDAITQAMGWGNFKTFVERSNLIDPVLESLAGDYYCYIRMQLEEGKVLRSPVKILTNGGGMSYHLQGGRLDYSGDIKKVDGCLFVLMTSADGTKSFYHVYRIGKMPSPAVLQGIFCGVSTDLNPIGGRAVLIRKKETFESLTKKKTNLQALLKSKHSIERRIAKYFKNRHENTITIKKPYTFGPDDL